MPYAPSLPLSLITSSAGLPSTTIHAAPDASGTGVDSANGSRSQPDGIGATSALPFGGSTQSLPLAGPTSRFFDGCRPHATPKATIRSSHRTSGVLARRMRYTSLVSERTYLVKEMFGPTLQGEGAHAGRACVFLRFAACNLDCTGCDTDFSPEGAQRYTPE